MRRHFLKKIFVSLFGLLSMVSVSSAVDVPKYEILDFVPADTAVFLGQFSSQSAKGQLSVAEHIFSGFVDQDYEDVLKDIKEPEVKFFASILHSYIEELGDSEKLIEKFGLTDLSRSVLYTVDFIPVYKFESKNPAAIWKILDKAEADSNFKGEVDKYKGIEYRSYKLTSEIDEELKVVVAAAGKWVTITIGFDDGNEEHFDYAFGIVKPEKTLNQTDILQKIVDKYEFDGEQISYFDHEKIVNTLTGLHSSAVIDRLDKDDERDIKTPACQQDIAAIVAKWPRTVVGTSKVEYEKTGFYVKSRLIIESLDADINEALMGMRGHIPEQNKNMPDPLFGMGFGLNVNDLTTNVTKLWKLAIDAKFECEEFVEAQKKLQEANPVLLNMATGMARGVHGIGFALFDLELDTEQGKKTEVKSMDAMISLYSTDPFAQFMSLSLANPDLAGVQLLTDGTEIDVTKYIPESKDVKGDVKMAINGQHLNTYTGDMARKSAQLLTDSSIEANGILGISVNYGMFFNLVKQNLIAEGKDIPVGLEQFFELDFNLVTKLDFSEYGIEYISEVRM